MKYGTGCATCAPAALASHSIDEPTIPSRVSTWRMSCLRGAAKRRRHPGISVQTDTRSWPPTVRSLVIPPFRPSHTAPEAQPDFRYRTDVPPLSSIRVTALRDLAEQLRFAPRDALLRDVERAEALAREVDPGRKYPSEWIVFRVTGYRPDTTPIEDVPVIGEVLLADLSAFVERLCDATKLAHSDAPAAIEAGALARKWNISRKTLDRYRRRGLVARRVVAEGGRASLVFMPAVVDDFAAKNTSAITRAAGFSRIPATLEHAIIRRATRYHNTLGWSLNQSAQRLAERLDRSHEAIRQVLKRAEQRAKTRGDAPIFDERGPISPRDRRILWRCWLRALEPGQVALRLKCSRSSALRAINLERAARLAALVNGPLADAPRTLPKANLNHPACTTALGQPGASSITDFFADADARGPSSASDEAARIAAIRHLRARAAHAIRLIDRLHPSAESLDAIETDLRWASRIKADLVRAQLPLVVATLRGRLADALLRLDPLHQRAAVFASLHGLFQAIDSHDPTSAPGRGGRLAGVASLEIDRALVRWMKDSAAHIPADNARAATRIASVSIPDWTCAIDPWQAWLEPPQRIRPVLHQLPELSRRCLSARFGWSGSPPVNAQQLGELLAQPRMRAAQLERRAMREALVAARSSVGISIKPTTQTMSKAPTTKDR